MKEQGDYLRIMRNVIEKGVGRVSNKLWDFMSHAKDGLRIDVTVNVSSGAVDFRVVKKLVLIKFM